MFPPSVLLNFLPGITPPRAFWMVSNERLAWNCKISHLPIKNVTSCIRWNTVTIEMNSSGRELASPAWTFFQSTAGLRHSTSKGTPSLFGGKRRDSRMKKEAYGVCFVAQVLAFLRLTWTSGAEFSATCLKHPPPAGKDKIGNKWASPWYLSLPSRCYVPIFHPKSWAFLINLNLQA